MGRVHIDGFIIFFQKVVTKILINVVKELLPEEKVIDLDEERVEGEVREEVPNPTTVEGVAMVAAIFSPLFYLKFFFSSFRS